MKRYHDVADLRFEENTLRLSIDGRLYSFSVSSISERLAKASQMERERFQISPSGYGIRWPLIDEDLSIDGLLGVTHHPKSVKEKVSTSPSSLD